MKRKVNKPRLADALIHPERLEILRAFQVSGPLTVRELRAALPAISQPTLYRHVRMLLCAGAIEISDIRQKKAGPPEKRYAIPKGAAQSVRLSGEERSPANLRRYFLAMQTAQISEFEKAVEGRPVDEHSLAIRYSLIYVNERELREIRRMLARLKSFESNPPAGRKGMSLGLVLYPAVTVRAGSRRGSASFR
jgi:DNA-binding transcriptional ArsR family regulator